MSKKNYIATSGIKRVLLENFRNFLKLERKFTDSKIKILYGNNGIGKTNFIEAIALLLRKNIRSASHKNMVNINNIDHGYTIYADSNLQNQDIKLSLNYSSLNNNISYKIDDKNKSRKDAGNICQLFYITPLMDNILLSTSERRNFLDTITREYHCDHNELLQQYEKLRIERMNILLFNYNDKWLDIIEEKLTNIITIIYYNRQYTIDLINKNMINSSVFPAPILSIEGDIEKIFAENKYSIDAENSIKKILKAGRKLDIDKKRMNIGVHKSDFTMIYNGKMAQFCSTGEQKSLLISVIITAVSRGTAISKILLLDDILSHLDSVKRQELIKIISDLEAQIWVTAVNKDDFANIGDICEFINIEAG